MTNQDNRSNTPADLRQKAEALAREQAALTPEDSAGLSLEEIRKTLHELRVHQIELEMQNEELRAAQAEIEAGRARYFDLYDLAPVGYCTLSEEGLILEANLTVATLLGTARGALVKRSISNYILKEDQDIYYLHRKRLFETGEPQECELRLVKPDGAAFWSHLTATAVQAEDGKPLCRAVISDITERKQVETALQENRDLLARSQQIGHIGSWNLDLKTSRLHWTDEVFRLFGYAPQEFTATYEAFLNAVHPDDRTAVDEAYYGSLRKNADSYEIEHRIVRPGTGEVRHVHERCVHERNEAGAVIRSIGMVQDITERKQAEYKHKQLLDEYETVFQGTQDAMFLIAVTDHNTFRYIRNNQAHVHETGFTTEFLADKTPQELVGDELGDTIAENYHRCVKAETPISFEETLDFPRGVRTWHTTLTPIFQQGKIKFIVGSSKDITKQKKVEEEIQRFKTIADNAVYGKAIVDLDGNIVYVNRFFAEIHGYSPEELIGSQVSMFNTPEQNKEIEQIFALLIQEGTFKPTEVWHVHRDGTEFPMLMSGVLLRDEHDNPQYLAASAIDMSAYHQAQKNYQLLFDTMQNGFALHEIICDDSGAPADYRFLSVNPAFENLTGLKAEDLIGRRVLEVLPNTEQYWLDVYGKVALTGNSDSFEHYSSEFEKYFEVIAFRPSEGQFACIFQDITERKLAEQFTHIRLSLLEYARNHTLEELLQRILEEAESLSGSCISFYHFVGGDQKNLLLHTWSARTLEQFCKAGEKGMHYSLDQAGVWADGVRNKQPVIHNDYASLSHQKGLPEGHASIIRELVVPILRRDNVVGILGIGNKPDDYTGRDKEIISSLADMTWEIIEHKRSEEQLKEMQVQLNQMQKMETVGRLAGGIAHDFNNMLGVILGRAEIGLELVSPGQVLHDNLKEIHKAAERSAELTAQLLAFARKQSVKLKVVDLNAEIVDMMKILQRLIGEDIDLLWRPGHDIWAVKIDPSQVHQILVNLCVNAREAISGVGKITIETKNTVLDAVYCAQHEQLIPGEYVLLSVSDDGCGIDETILPQVFEPFFTTRDVGDGTGMGLATVYGIVKQNLGCINVHSERGQGTAMKIYLPKHYTKKEQTNDETVPQVVEHGTGAVLLVDDNPAILSMTRKLLERLGYTVFAAGSPREAIRIAETSDHSIDILITDLVMPDMNGRDLADTVLNMHPDIKLLFMSGYADKAIVHQNVLDKGASFIQKPFSMKELSERVNELLLS